jgi:Uma2 family endonuclease
VEKDVKQPAHYTATDRTRRAVERLLPPGWYVRQEAPVRIPSRRSEPEPNLAVVRGGIDDYASRHPEPADVALVVEVTRSSAAKDRALARVYGPGGIPVYWIVNVPKRQLEVYTDPDPAGGYRSRADYRPGQDVPVIIDVQEVGRIPVAELLP